MLTRIPLFPVQETKKKQQLKVKMQMAKFLQETINDMAVSSKNPDKKESVEEFARFFEKVSLISAIWNLCEV